jgi:hypothetical protein
MHFLSPRGAQPYYVNTQMRMKNPWGGIKSWALGGKLCPKYAKTHLQASVIAKIFPGVIPPDPR